jgi:hypothetical protein
LSLLSWAKQLRVPMTARSRPGTSLVRVRAKPEADRSPFAAVRIRPVPGTDAALRVVLPNGTRLEVPERDSAVPPDNLTFHDFPAEHWRHLRTTNPIESTFATSRLRHRRTKGNGTRQASLVMMFNLAQSAAKHWRKLNSPELILSLLEGKVFTDGVLQLTHAA